MRWNGKVYKILYHKKAIKEMEYLKRRNLENKTKKLIEIIKKNPYQNPPPYEQLVGDLKGLYSRRINIQHRLLYQIDEDAQRIKILSMWTHYENI